MLVKAAPGLQVPREENPRTYIGSAAVEIVPTAYYIRRIAAGELQEVAAAAPGPTSSAASKKSDKG
ncbi:MAG: DUF2635 domain-containing protein [Ramlibacter sp.]|nr:DUF2635 domain-containing protein [Ramlibacter sp.]